MRTKGSPQERREQREQRRIANRLTFVRQRAGQASGGHQRVVLACNTALAASRRISDDARRILARDIADAVQAADIPSNWKERS